MGDGDPFLREMAIQSLERIAKVRPEMLPKVIRALDANLDSSDRKLREACGRKREMYRLKMMPDEEVIRLLDDPRQFLIGISLIKQRKMTAATPILLEITHSESTGSRTKLYAAKTLLSLGNRQWIEPMKGISADPNIPMLRRLATAGLLAQAGDYTQFEVVSGSLENDDDRIRQEAVKILPDFKGRATQVTELLVSLGEHDGNPGVRMAAIASIEKMVSERPEVLPLLLQVLEANVNSENAYLQKQCEAKLKQYGKAAVQE